MDNFFEPFIYVCKKIRDQHVKSHFLPTVENQNTGICCGSPLHYYYQVGPPVSSSYKDIILSNNRLLTIKYYARDQTEENECCGRSRQGGT